MEEICQARSAYRNFTRPGVAELLKILRLDKVYHRAEGANLYYEDRKGLEKKVSDFVGGYGSLLAGHHPPELEMEAKTILKDKRPVLDQLAVREAAGRLAARLNALLPFEEEYVVTLGNSGAEGVEAARKHALLVWHNRLKELQDQFQQSANLLIAQCRQTTEPIDYRLNGAVFQSPEALVRYVHARNQQVINESPSRFIALERAYHGKSSGALSLTWNPEFKAPFGAEPDAVGNRLTDFCKLEKGALTSLMQSGERHLLLPRLTPAGEIALRKVSWNRYAGFFVEPVQGEGGIHPLPHTLLVQFWKLCEWHGVPLILDEIQSGLFRTGSMLAIGGMELVPDYIILGKALGGGLAKISAMLVRKSIYDKSFGLLHSSTFAEDGFASGIALRSLDVLAGLAPQVQRAGFQLKSRLEELQARFPEVLKEVRGAGLMIGIEFRSFRESSCLGFQALDRTGYLNYVYAGYLLNQFDVRVAAPLSAPSCLRIQPPAIMDEKGYDRLQAGLEALCQILACMDLYRLIEYTLPESYQGLRKRVEDFSRPDIERLPVPAGARKVGFVSHFIHAGTLQEAEPSLSILDEACIHYLLNKFLPVAQPMIPGTQVIRDSGGKAVHLTMVGMVFTSAMCRKAMLEGEAEAFEAQCHAAVALLKAEGCELVGLGQYSSILTRNGFSVPEYEVGLTTGNSYTVGLGIDALLEKARESGINLRKEAIAIIGAGGNIANVYAEIMVGMVEEVLCYGGPDERGYQKAEKCAYQVMKGPRRLGRVKAVRSLDALRHCKLVVVATNAAEPFLKPGHFPEGAVICDISVPVNCTPALLQNNKGIQVILGGVARLPHEERVPADGFPLEKGRVFGCLGETLLLGLSDWQGPYSFGRVRSEQVNDMLKRAKVHGFALERAKQEKAY